MMRLPLRPAALLAAMLVAAVPGCGPREKPLPTRTGMVNDFAAVLGPEAAASLEQLLREYERETCHHFVLLTLPSLEGEPIGALAARVMAAWKIGEGPVGRGLLLTLSMEEGTARVDAGTALERLVRSGRAEAIVREEMFPFFAQGRFEEGIGRGLEALMEEGRSVTYPPELRPAPCR